ncbi:rhodanese-like domain-containing protein [candidate division KSB1 bacterium]|nr:rhodanese-like domain-containing protein [candidate division KSB1 bacterium]
MMKLLSGWTWTQKCALIALALGVGAVLPGSPYRGTRVSLDMKELGLIVQNETDHISAPELADWIIQGRADYRLIDVRSDAEYNEYHIQGAESIPVGELATAELGRNEKLVLYSEGGIHAAQAWMLLAGRGFKHSYMLTGGLDEWKDRILFPRLPESPLPAQRDSLARVKSVCAFFGGTPQSGAAEDALTDSKRVPKLQIPTGGTGTPKAAGGKKKKKEGC